MTQRKHVTRSCRVIAGIIEHKTRSDSRRRNLVLLPKLPIGRKETGNLIGFPTEISVIRSVTTNDSVPAIRGDFNCATVPVLLLQPCCLSTRDIFRTPHNLVVARQEGAYLANPEERYRIAELHGVDVPSVAIGDRRCNGLGREIGTDCTVCRRIFCGVSPAVRPLQST